MKNAMSRTKQHLPLSSRQKLIESLQSRIVSKLRTATQVTSITAEHGRCQVGIRDASAFETCLTPDGLILASGRFGPLLTQSSLGISHVFRRLEVGVRIEQPSGIFFLAQHKQLDPKLILKDPQKGLEWRTFCCCRQGEVVAIRHQGVIAVSGRSDVIKTDFSNIGFLVRFTDKDCSDRLWPQLLGRVRSLSVPAKMPLVDFVQSKDPQNTPIGLVLGPDVANAIVYGLRGLLAEFGPENFNDAILHAPAMEGLARYPLFDQSLKSPDGPIWGAGDVTGL